MLATEAARENKKCSDVRIDWYKINMQYNGIHGIPSSALSGGAAGQQDLEAYEKNYPFLHCLSS